MDGGFAVAVNVWPLPAQPVGISSWHDSSAAQADTAGTRRSPLQFSHPDTWVNRIQSVRTEAPLIYDPLRVQVAELPISTCVEGHNSPRLNRERT